MKVTVLGDGAWGTAVAWLLAENGHEVTVWCNDAEVMQTMSDHHVNERYLPGILLPSSITATVDLKEALRNELIFEAVPVKFLRSVLQKAQPHTSDDKIWVVLSKGIEVGTLMLPTQILENVLGNAVKTVVISGPSFAHDLVRRQITAVSIASKNSECIHPVQRAMDNDFFKTELSTDPIGLQVGGALKNVIALGIGILDGAGYGDNPQAFFLTRGLQELAHIAAALGGKRESVYGLSGMGDLVLTSMGKHSKNRALGRRLGLGESLSSLSMDGTLPEGCNSLQSVQQIIERFSINALLCSGLYNVVFAGHSLNEYLHGLLKN